MNVDFKVTLNGNKLAVSQFAFLYRKPVNGACNENTIFIIVSFPKIRVEFG
jgi:hypothetical protein